MKINRRRLPPGMPFVPMADIIFNLILFFIILAKTDDTSNLQWSPATSPGLESIPNARFSVTIDKDGFTYLNGDRVGVAEITGRLEAGLASIPAGNRHVLLKIHKDTQAHLFEPVIEAVSQAGGDIVHVLEQERD
jgi:biopolymer transport protein ExbD